MTSEEQKGFDAAIDRVIQLCEKQASDYAKNREHLQIKHRESMPYHYKAMAMKDFKQYLEELFQMTVELSA